MKEVEGELVIVYKGPLFLYPPFKKELENRRQQRRWEKLPTRFPKPESKVKRQKKLPEEWFKL